MGKWLCILILILSPTILFAQNKSDSSTQNNVKKQPPFRHKYHGDSTFSFMFNPSNVFYTARDSRINKFMEKYGYVPPQQIPVGIRLELSVMPFGSKMMYSIHAATILSRQDIATADFSLSAYRFIAETKNIWVAAGVGLGIHFDRIVLSGQLPPSFDSLENEYKSTLSLHRSGLVAEPGAKLFWYPWQKRKIQLGLFSGIGYDFDFNSHWHLGYYPQNRHTFKRIKKPTNVGTVHEFGWVFNLGLSLCF
jgi:hypothetical protein